MVCLEGKLRSKINAENKTYTLYLLALTGIDQREIKKKAEVT